jgi:hypothetical protein
VTRILRCSLYLLVVGGVGLAMLRFHGASPRTTAATMSPADRSSARQSAANPQPAADASYPYLGERFRELVSESCLRCGLGGGDDFYTWMTKAYADAGCHLPGKEGLTLEEALRAQRQELAALPDRSKRVEGELAACRWVHGLVKTVIPRFSLERGFEFGNVVKRGERQCFLQSVLIAGLLQEMGVDAGVVMVNVSERGQESNNGHAAALVALADGRDVIVDASDAEPFARHRGLFGRCLDYQYVRPVYDAHSALISHYRTAAAGRMIEAKQFRPLDLRFLRSQFWYYRGERAADGVLAPKPTAQGMRASGRDLERSTQLCPRNPLAVYMLGRVYLWQGRVGEARELLERACTLYARYGWVPGGPREYLALAKKRGGQSARAAVPR